MLSRKVRLRWLLNRSEEAGRQIPIREQEVRRRLGLKDTGKRTTSVSCSMTNHRSFVRMACNMRPSSCIATGHLRVAAQIRYFQCVSFNSATHRIRSNPRTTFNMYVPFVTRVRNAIIEAGHQPNATHRCRVPTCDVTQKLPRPRQSGSPSHHAGHLVLDS